MGRYVPPDLEGVLAPNAASGKGHALGARARKLKTEGVLTVRFELPFAVWCTTCQPEQIVGQGVRFNAEKKKVGNHYSTPIWQFRFKHTACGGWIEVRTDPASAEYVVVGGGRRRDLGLDKLREGEIVIGSLATEEERSRLERDGGFGSLEKKVVDKETARTEAKRIEELKRASEKVWADPYERNKELRRDFRVGRRKRDDDRKTGEALQEKFGLDLEVQGEIESDKIRAGLIQYGASDAGNQDTRPMFTNSTTEPASDTKVERGRRGKQMTSAEIAEAKKRALQLRLSGNSRAAIDPFVKEGEIWAPKVKRKRVEVDPSQEPGSVISGSALVDYNSDSC